MNDWQKRFSQKVELVRGTARQQFEELCERIISPTFEEYRSFTTAQGFCATAPVKKADVRAFKFAMTENTYLLMTFRLAGFEHCELQSDLFIPGEDKHACTPVHVELSDLDVGWTRRMFEHALDAFVDRFVGSLSKREETLVDVIGT